jgi:hypothetical protein
MRYKSTLILIQLLLSLNLFGQNKLNGQYNPVFNEFHSTDAGVLTTAQFVNGCAPFLIKYKKFVNNYLDGKVGFIDKAGNVIIKPIYDECTYFNGNFAIARDSTGRGMINKSGEIIFPFGGQYIAKCSNGLFIISKQTLSIRDSTNKIIVPFGVYRKYATPAMLKVTTWGDDGPLRGWTLQDFHTSVSFKNFLGLLKEKKWAVINNKGREIIPPTFDWIGIFNGQIAPVRIGSKFGITNSRGKFVVPLEYDDARILEKHFIQVELNKKCGVITTDNKVVIPLLYHDVTLINRDNFLVDTGGNYGVIDKHNRPVIPIKFSQIQSFGNGYFVTDKNYETDVYNASGKLITVFSKGTVMQIMQNGLIWKFKDNTSVVIRKKTLDLVYYGWVKDELTYSRNGKWGLLDKNGEEVTPALYDEAESLTNSTYKVENNNKWGVIDNKGKVLIKCLYSKAELDDRLRL